MRTQKSPRPRAAQVQRHWNDALTRAQRESLYVRFEGRLSRLFERLGLSGLCNECWRIFDPCEFDEGPDGFACPECHSTEVQASGNPLPQPETDADRSERYWSHFHDE